MVDVLHVMVPMRDGVELATDVMLPLDDGPHPVLVQRTPYGKSTTYPTPAPPSALAHAAAGRFAIVVQDKRGRFDSEGTYRLFADDGEGEHQDGFDTIAWVAAQPWCDGRIAVEGISYVGHTAIAAAMTAPPHLRCAVVTQPATDMFTEERFVDGAFLTMVGMWNELGGLDVVDKTLDESGRARALDELRVLQRDRAGAYRTLPITDVPYQRHLPGLWADVLAHRDDPDWFPNTTTREKVRNIRVPVLHVGSWFDPFLRNTLRHFRYTREETAASIRDEHRLVIGPWLHGRFVAPTINGVQLTDGDLDYTRLVGEWAQRWFDAALAADPLKPHDHRVMVYVLGADRWRASVAWPPPEAVETPFFLRGGGRLSTDAPHDERPETFSYDPREPYAAPSVVAGPLDHRAHHSGSNLLVYETEPLTEAVEVIGPVGMMLWAASSGTDTDWVAELHDVHPGGSAILLAEGITRARYRHSRTEPEPLTPGQPEAFEIDMRAVANVFEVGHAIRLVITSGKEGRFERNPNAFVDLNTCLDADLCSAQQTVFHDGDRTSQLCLWVVPPAAARSWVSNPAPLGANSGGDALA